MFDMRIGWTLLWSTVQLTVAATLCAAAVSRTPTAAEENRALDGTRVVVSSNARGLAFTPTSAEELARTRIRGVSDSATVPQNVRVIGGPLLLFVLLGLAAAVAALSVRMVSQSPGSLSPSDLPSHTVRSKKASTILPHHM